MRVKQLGTYYLPESLELIKLIHHYMDTKYEHSIELYNLVLLLSTANKALLELSNSYLIFEDFLKIISKENINIEPSQMA